VVKEKKRKEKKIAFINKYKRNYSVLSPKVVYLKPVTLMHSSSQ
jgi:hypothetical protein